MGGGGAHTVGACAMSPSCGDAVGLACGGSPTCTVNIKHTRSRLVRMAMTRAMSGTNLILCSVIVLTTLRTRQVGSATSALAANKATLQWFGLAVKFIPPDAWLSRDMTTLPLELVDSDRW